jgi:hypothetical protein
MTISRETYKLPRTVCSFRKIAFFGADAVVFRPVYEHVDFAPFSVIRSLGWPVADHV